MCKIFHTSLYLKSLVSSICHNLSYAGLVLNAVQNCLSSSYIAHVVGWLHGCSPTGHGCYLFRESVDSYQVSTLGIVWIPFIFLTLLIFGLLSTVNGSSQNPAGINSSWISQFILSSVIWWHLCPRICLAVIHGNSYRLCRISIALTFARVFPAFHNARRSALFLSVMFFLCYLSTVFINTFSCPNGTRLTAWYQSIFLNCLQSNKAFLGGLIMTSCESFFAPPLFVFCVERFWRRY